MFYLIFIVSVNYEIHVHSHLLFYYFYSKLFFVSFSRCKSIKQNIDGINTHLKHPAPTPLVLVFNLMQRNNWRLYLYLYSVPILRWKSLWKKSTRNMPMDFIPKPAYNFRRRLFWIWATIILTVKCQALFKIQGSSLNWYELKNVLKFNVVEL